MNKSNTVDKGTRVSMIAALGKNRVIGKNNELLWHIPDDLSRFKVITLTRPVIMGRKTFESILRIIKKPLTKRINMVITRDPKWSYPGIITVHSLEEALRKAKVMDRTELFIIGGGEIYKEALPFADRLYLTLIDDEKEGDTYFPPYEHLFTKKIAEESREFNGLKYKWVDLER